MVVFVRFQFSVHGDQLYKINSLEFSLSLIIWPPSAIVLYPRGLSETQEYRFYNIYMPTLVNSARFTMIPASKLMDWGIPSIFEWMLITILNDKPLKPALCFFKTCSAHFCLESRSSKVVQSSSLELKVESP